VDGIVRQEGWAWRSVRRKGGRGILLTEVRAERPVRERRGPGAPNLEVRRLRWITPGAVVGVALWILASAVFFVYVSHFSSYGATYGAFAGVVVLLVWQWLTNLVLLFGAELNAVADVRRARHRPPDYDGPVLPATVPAKR
jgi:membrane protein